MKLVEVEGVWVNLEQVVMARPTIRVSGAEPEHASELVMTSGIQAFRMPVADLVDLLRRASRA